MRATTDCWAWQRSTKGPGLHCTDPLVKDLKRITGSYEGLHEGHTGAAGSCAECGGCVRRLCCLDVCIQ